jgi:hypothetical protein
LSVHPIRLKGILIVSTPTVETIQVEDVFDVDVREVVGSAQQDGPGTAQAVTFIFCTGLFCTD